MAGDLIYKTIIKPPSLITSAEIQTVEEGVSFNQNLTLQPSEGKVGIGTTNVLSRWTVKSHFNERTAGFFV